MFGMFKKDSIKYHITREGVTWYDPHLKELRSADAGKDFEGYIEAIGTLKDGRIPSESSYENKINELTGPKPEFVAASEKLSKRWDDAASLGLTTGRGVRDSLSKFHDRLKRNPSFRSREQLLTFMDHNDIPLQPNGKLLAFKAVREDYFDHHTGKSNEYLVGTTHDLDRSTVSDDPSSACSAGLHVGGYKYVGQFYGNRDRLMAIEVDPQHVVCVPNDARYGKIRVCELDVIAEMDGVEDMSKASSHMLAYKQENGTGDSLSDLIQLVGKVLDTRGNTSVTAKRAVVDFYIGDVNEDMLSADMEYREVVEMLKTRQEDMDADLEEEADNHESEIGTW